MIKASSKQTGSMHVVIVIAIVLVVLSALGFVFWKNFVSKDEKSTANKIEVTSQNKDNAAALKAEKEKTPIIIDNGTPIDSQNKTDNSSSDAATNKEPTVDSSGLSTNLSRAEVRPAVVAVLALYQDFLAKLQAVPASQRQAIADQYLADNSAMFSPNYGYLSSYSLHLFPQSADVDLPDSVSINSAIVNPDDSSQTIVQVYKYPNNSWSMLVYVKMNTDGTIATLENLVIRMNQNPL
ncbi:MAG: hypothetical protein JWP06_1043 [Candidatus Saccharibacteria bacterium]|nr:hypothetical protein [Candidatus Saccharibacteria bacterium]